jgi:hypothetical protein
MTWRARRDPVWWVSVVVALLVIGWLCVSTVRCAPARSPLSEVCPAIAKIWAEGLAAEDEAGCSSDPVRLCPDLVAEYDRRIDAVPDEACP